MELFKTAPKLVKNLPEIWHKYGIDPDYRNKISFQELLVIGKFICGEDTPVPLGSVCLNIVNALNNPDKLVVYLRSTFDIDGRKAGSKITSWLDSQLHTIEEKRTEFLEQCLQSECEEMYAKQSLYLSVQKDQIYVHHVEENCGQKSTTGKHFPFEIAQNLVSEGASFALMRLLAIEKYIGQFEVTTLYINGSLCRNIYMCTGPEGGMVNGKKMDVCKIYRKIVEECGITHICCTVLICSTGRIITSEWEDCEYVIYLNPLLDVTPPGINTVMRTDFFQDLQLFSKYVDKKKIYLNRIRNYVKEKPDIQNILLDYVQTILQMKPPDAVEFTTEYFTRYATNKL